MIPDDGAGSSRSPYHGDPPVSASGATSAAIPLTATAYDPSAPTVTSVSAGFSSFGPAVSSSGKSFGPELALPSRADYTPDDTYEYLVTGSDPQLIVHSTIFGGSVTAKDGGTAVVSNQGDLIDGTLIPSNLVGADIDAAPVIADGMLLDRWGGTQSQIDFNRYNTVWFGAPVAARNGGVVNFNYIGNTDLHIHTIGNNNNPTDPGSWNHNSYNGRIKISGQFLPPTAAVPGGYVWINGGGSGNSSGWFDYTPPTPASDGNPAPLTISNSIFGSDGPGIAGPTAVIYGFGNIKLGRGLPTSGVLVDRGGLLIVGVGYNDATTGQDVVGTRVSGAPDANDGGRALDIVNGGRVSFYNLYLGDPNSDTATVIHVDAKSSLTLGDPTNFGTNKVTLYNMGWGEGMNGTMNIYGTVMDGGGSIVATGGNTSATGFDLYGTITYPANHTSPLDAIYTGVLNLGPYATLTTENQSTSNILMFHGHPGITLTGQGTVDQAYPINHGTILSPSSGTLTINALPSGQSWAPILPPGETQPQISGSSQTFYNYSDGIIRYTANGGGLNFNGFSDGLNNQGLFEVLLADGQISPDWLTASGFAPHIFSDATPGFIRANGNGTLSSINASDGSISYQQLQAINNATLTLDGYPLSHISLWAAQNGKINLLNVASLSLDRFYEPTMVDDTGQIRISGIGITFGSDGKPISPIGSSILWLNSPNLTAGTHDEDSRVSISGFTKYQLTAAVVQDGPMITLPGIINPVDPTDVTKYTTLKGDLNFIRSKGSVLADMNVGSPWPTMDPPHEPPTVVNVDKDSDLTVRNIDTYNTLWIDNGTIYVDGIVRDGGYDTGLSGSGTLFIKAGAIMKTTGNDLGSRWNVFGMSGMTLTGQGTADQMYPVNHGTILSPTSGQLTIKALPSGSWVNDPISPLRGTSQTFSNYSDGTISYQGTGGINFKGFTDGLNNQGTVVASGLNSMSDTNGFFGHIFSHKADGSADTAGVLRASGTGVAGATVWTVDVSSLPTALIETQLLEAKNYGALDFNGYSLSDVALNAISHGSIVLTGIGHATFDNFAPANLGDSTGQVTLMGRGSATATASLTLNSANLTRDPTAPTLTIGGFTLYQLGTGSAADGSTVDRGKMINLPGIVGTDGTKYTTLTGNLSIVHGGSGTLANVMIGDTTANSPLTTLTIDPTSTFTLDNVDLANTKLIVDATGPLLNSGAPYPSGILYLSNRVTFGGNPAPEVNTSMHTAGYGTLFINAGGILTMYDQTALGGWSTALTLTGRGTLDRMHPTTNGQPGSPQTILSPTRTVADGVAPALTINAPPVGAGWLPIPANPIYGTWQTFYNKPYGVLEYTGGGGLIFNGFTDGLDNQGLVEVKSSASVLASAGGLFGHIFSSQAGVYGTLLANGAAATGLLPITSSPTALVEEQNIQALNGGVVNFSGFDVKNSILNSTPVNPGDTAGAFQVGNGAVAGTIGTASQDVSALTTFSNTTLTGTATVITLTGTQSFALDASQPGTPGLHVTGGAQLQLLGDSGSTIYGTATTPAAGASSLGYGIGRILVDNGGLMSGAGNTTAHQFGLALGSGGTLTVSNPNQPHTAGTINLADAPVLAPASPFRFSAASAPRTGAAGTLSAASLPGATSAQTLTVLGDLQMSAGSTLAVSIFGDSTNANSLLMAGSSGTAASTLAGTLSVTVGPGVASLSASTLFVVFQENGAGYGASRFGNAPTTGSTITSADGNWIFGVNYVGSQVILGNATAVPEPSTCAALAGLAALGLATWRRRRSRLLPIP